MQERFYIVDISTFSMGGQFDTFCMVVSVDPKTVISISDVFYVFCFGSHEESKRSMFVSVSVTGGKGGGVFLFLSVYDSVTYHFIGKGEVETVAVTFVNI